MRQPPGYKVCCFHNTFHALLTDHPLPHRTTEINLSDSPLHPYVTGGTTRYYGNSGTTHFTADHTISHSFRRISNIILCINRLIGLGTMDTLITYYCRDKAPFFKMP